MPLLILIIGGILLLWAFYLIARATSLAPRYYEDWDEEDWDDEEDWEEEEWEEDKPRRRKYERATPHKRGTRISKSGYYPEYGAFIDVSNPLPRRKTKR